MDYVLALVVMFVVFVVPVAIVLGLMRPSHAVRRGALPAEPREGPATVITSERPEH